MGRTAFTLWEGDVAIYLSDATDTPLGEALFIGHCFERIDCTRQHTVVRRPFLGRRWQENYNADEEHTIELRTPFQVGPLGELKSLYRFGRHILVLVWHDEDRRVWLKRTYFGVSDVTEQVSGAAGIENGMTLRAERLEQSSGAASWPDLTPLGVGGRVDWVLGALRVPLYQYDAGAVFTALSTQDDDLARIYEDGSGVEFEIDGTLAMRADATGLIVGALIATGGSFFDTDDPKLEFLTAGVRVATLAKDGTLAVPSAAAAGAAPGVATDLEIKPSGAWSASLGLGRTTAKGFADTLP